MKIYISNYVNLPNVGYISFYLISNSTFLINTNKLNFDWQYRTTIGQYYTAPSGYSYAVVDLYIQNEDDRMISTNPYFWNLVADGIKYTVDVASFSDGINHQTVEVGKGGEIEVQLVYLVKGSPMEASIDYTGFSQPNVQRIEYYPKS